MFLIEVGLVLLSLFAAFICPCFLSDWFAPVERGLARLARRRTLSVIVVGLSALGLRLALLPILPIPQPVIHDEYSFLLMADTFAHGRATNPPHPMWVHFETFHIFEQPTYASKYFPAQGVFLAVGEILGHNPFWGVWFSIGLMCAAICWMLQGWLSPFWALVGSLMAVTRFATFNYWDNSYYGGAVAAIGGALMLGALPRIKRRLRIRDALLLGLGMALLVNSRPYEGLFFGLPIGVALLIWMLKGRIPLRRLVQRFLLPVAICATVTASAMGYYFWRVTGSPLQSPYEVSIRTYEPVPLFPWQTMKGIPAYRHSAIRDFYVTSAMPSYELTRAHFVIAAVSKSIHMWLFFLGPVFTLPICLLAFALPYGMSYKDISPGARFLLTVCCVSFGGALLPIYFNVHYVAALTAAIFALVLLAMRRVRKWGWRDRPVGLRVVRAVPVICILLVLVRAAAPLTSIPPCQETPRTWCSLTDHGQGRAPILDALEGQPRGQLAIVHYEPGHDLNNEWVYNRADIDGSRVVWARDMGPEQNLELIRYFKDRKVWLVEPDLIPPQLSVYSVTPSH
jgi:hypothetical protein